jgi:hypothetical protein
MKSTYRLALEAVIGLGEWTTTKELDVTLLEVWGNKYDAGMCCNSFMRDGFIEYFCDGDWRVNLVLDDLIEDDASIV